MLYKFILFSILTVFGASMKPTDMYKDTVVIRGAKPTDMYKDTNITKSYIYNKNFNVVK